MRNTHRIAQGCALSDPLTTRSIRKVSIYRADDKDDPIFSRSGSLSSSLLEEKFPMRRTRSRANISFMQN